MTCNSLPTSEEATVVFVIFVKVTEHLLKCQNFDWVATKIVSERIMLLPDPCVTSELGDCGDVVVLS
jgi:hypothetical protein